MANESKGTLEGSVTGLGFGCVLGGWFFGVADYFLGEPIHTMAAFAIGGVLGAIAGLVAGRIGTAVLLKD